MNQTNSQRTHCAGQPHTNAMHYLSRREWLGKFGHGVGAMALSSLLANDLASAATHRSTPELHHAPKAKRIIFLFQSGAPSQMDLFDHKPMLNKLNGEELPASVAYGAASNRNECTSGELALGRISVQIFTAR